MMKFPLTKISYKFIDVYYATYFIINMILKLGKKFHVFIVEGYR